jgi:hypothetical protein
MSDLAKKIDPFLTSRSFAATGSVSQSVFLLRFSVNLYLLPESLSDFDQTWSVEPVTHCAFAVFTELGSEVI